MGQDMVTARATVDKTLFGENEDEAQDEDVPSELDNDAALAELQTMMANIG